MAEKKSIENLTKQQLVEMLNREQKLVNNEKILETLPDRGEKVINLVERLKQEIAVRDQIDATASRLGSLNISDDSRKNVNRAPKCSGLDSDDDDDDEFGGNLGKSNEPIKNVEKEKDFIEVKGSEKHIKTEKQFKDSKNKTSFMWSYESAVTPHPYKYQKAKMITLQESFTLQQEQQKNWEQLQAEHAARRLQDYSCGPVLGLSSSTPPPLQATSQYRNTTVKNYDDDDDDDNDDDDDSEKGLDENDDNPRDKY